MSIDLVENTQQVIKIVTQWLGEQRAYTSVPYRCSINGITPASYFVSVMRVHPKEIFVQEIFSSDVRGQIVYRSWTFRLEESWFIAALEHFSRAVPYGKIRPQMEDLVRRLELILELQSRGGSYFTETAAKAPQELSIDIPSDAELQRTGIISRFSHSFARHSVPYTVAAIALGILLLLGIHVLRIQSLEEQMSRSIRAYTSQMDHQVQDFISSTEKEIVELINNLQENRKNFNFDRQNAYISVTRMAEELAHYLPARKRAYRLIAENIRQANSYSEIFYEMTRLPTEEYQARIFLATDRQTVVPLSQSTPVFPSMYYPVKIEDEKNDGRGFRITDGYMDQRKDPVGTGGVTPHFAVDIINVSNISYVNHAGEIIREGKPPGQVVAAYQGRVIENAYDNRYGWFVEIEHPMIDEVKEKYPRAESWSTYYSHMDKQSPFLPGEDVEANQVLSPIGDSGKSTGPHLHFEVRVYSPEGRYITEGRHYDKINPFPEVDS
ncbi:MAG TPA: M23 family metallopeptidase [Sediminispirochaeta sp.]|nr:M23 family metallopeptidase [Sediminispirochaeta sp.]